MSNTKSSFLYNFALLFVFILLVLLLLDFALFISYFPFRQLVLTSWVLTSLILLCAIPLFILSIKKKSVLDESKSSPFWSTYNFVSINCRLWRVSQSAENLSLYFHQQFIFLNVWQFTVSKFLQVPCFNNSQSVSFTVWTNLHLFWWHNSFFRLGYLTGLKIFWKQRSRFSIN